MRNLESEKRKRNCDEEIMPVSSHLKKIDYTSDEK